MNAVIALPSAAGSMRRMSALPRRRLLQAALVPTLPALTLLAAPALAQGDAPPLLAAVRLLMGVERLAKLRLQLPLLPEQAEAALRRAQAQLQQDLQQLRSASPRALAALPARRQAQLQSTAEEVSAFAAGLLQPTPPAVQRLVGDSEALVARLGFATTALSGAAGQAGAQVDLFCRAAATALRVAKLNFAALQLPQETGLRVSASQAVQEFGASLQAVGAQSLSEAQRAALRLAEQQWLLFRATLDAQGLIKGRERLAEVASTTERMAQSLAEMAERALR